MKKNKSGVEKCEEAFNRLTKGIPENSTHIGLPNNRITAGIVSVEAGFDRGYLKKSRSSHINLIRMIEENRKSDKKQANHTFQIKQTKKRELSALEEKSEMKKMLDLVLTQNLLLVERIRDLELKIKNDKNTFDIIKDS